jgi:hypothetical protein
LRGHFGKLTAADQAKGGRGFLFKLHLLLTESIFSSPQRVGILGSIQDNNPGKNWKNREIPSPREIRMTKCPELFRVSCRSTLENGARL